MIIKNINYVISEEKSAKNQNKISFHRCMRAVFNSQVLDNVDISQGDYVSFGHNMFSRTIVLRIVKPEKHNSDDIRAYKVGNPKFVKNGRYLSVRSSSLIFDCNVCPMGAFDYEYHVCENHPYFKGYITIQY